jgi:hypothetical protein
VHDVARPGKHPRRDFIPAVEAEINFHWLAGLELEDELPGLIELGNDLLCQRKPEWHEKSSCKPVER